ncbi:HPr family phosphocarrier protein [Clostridium boliviensis]|uniref:HPr family phosphocarrier protein n=1 Tax=Clostridium boliviensis TaxID=318465 RepID=A0ABU4GLL5_9CLOT|nr:HPr family phosphocarrier protein [Clostridium boliviensis]MDW2797887.1 HPr family phosphocarrier protein [Clostridium boliviensis]
MIKRSVVVANDLGLHARPALLLVRLLKEYPCDIQVYKNELISKKYQPKDILSVMSMDAVKGDVLTFEAAGVKAEEALLAVEAFIRNNCGE